MCGIFALFDVPQDPAAARELALKQARLLRHRGPDWSGVWSGPRAVLAHERLAIVDVLHGAQPLTSPDGTLVLAVNGEIYNHREIRSHLHRATTSRPTPTAKSSCPSTGRRGRPSSTDCAACSPSRSMTPGATTG